MNKSKQLMTFQLSVLSTLMLCTTANNYASDIEIYKAPEPSDGKAKVMLTLDNSTMMHQSPQSAGGGKPINEDFGSSLCSSSVGSDVTTEVKTVTVGANSYTYNAYYCPISKADVDKSKNTSQINAPRIRDACPLTSDGLTYLCYDRFTMLKQSLFDVIRSTSLGSNIAIGLSYFPPLRDASGKEVIIQPLNLTDANRDALVRTVVAVQPSQVNLGEKQAPVSKAYGGGAQSLIEPVIGQVDQCSGYGIYSLTAGTPTHDEMGTARTRMNSVLQTTSPILNNTQQCPDGGSGTSASSGASWNCIVTGADLFATGKSRLAVPVKSAVVSFGTGFGFYGSGDTTRDFPAYTATVTPAAIRQTAQTIISRNKNIEPLILDQQNAIITGIVGGGGYYVANGGSDVTNSILGFIADILEVDIPYIITGAPTIPQDPLNPALVQDDAYYSQFKPTPKVVATEGSRFWLGNLKKYRINELGRLIDKNGDGILNLTTGKLEENYDFWSPPVSSDKTIAGADENTWGSDLYARMGGVKSQLPLGTSIVSDVQVANRKLLTNRKITTSGTTVTASESTTLTRIGTDYSANDPKRSDIMSLLQLRQVGAIMHSSPLLLSNKGKMVYDSTTDTLGSTNREDYILFGSTQGLLHVVKAKDYAEVDGVGNGGGKEVFAFVPHEMIENQSKAFLTPEATSGGSASLFYGIDAPWTAYTEYVVDSSGNLTVGTGKTVGTNTTLKGKQLVYGGLRMGGRSYYALDLADMNDPALKFHINPADQKVYYGSGSTTFSPLQYMGQSWSKPKMAQVNWNGSRKLVMFVGGGYDAGGVNGSGLDASGNRVIGGYEGDSYDQSNKIGAGVYMFDALNGDLLWWASSNATATSATTTSTGVIALKDDNLKYSVASEIKTADRNNDGLVDHLYFGDLGGQLFRIDLNNNASAIGAFATRSVRLLNLHQTGGTSPRFYASPAFSTYKDSESGSLFAAISIGSGNLSRPLVEYSTGRDFDSLYTVYDKDVARADLYSTITVNTQDVALTGTKVLNEITNNNRFANETLIAPYSSSYGWYFKFKGDNNIAQQEKLFHSPTVIDYDLYISSYDSSQLGLSGVCGGGVQGESKVRLFCMPFGQCAASRGFTAENSISRHGPGIQNHAIGGVGGGTTRLIGGAILDSNLDDQYQTKVKFIAQRWYERY